jgi:hypothetical protein
MKASKRRKLTDKLIQDDITSITESMYINNYSFLSAVLGGEGWIPYNQLSDKELKREHKEREFIDGSK